MTEREEFHQFMKVEDSLSPLDRLKGTTLYRAGSRGEEPLEPIPTADVARVLMESGLKAKVEFDVYDQSSLECVGGVCDLPQRVVSVR